MITTGAALLILPGFITSAIGLLLLFPPTRYLVRILVFFLFASRFKVATTTATWGASQYGNYRSGKQTYDMDGEAVDVTDRPDGMSPQLSAPRTDEQQGPTGAGGSGSRRGDSGESADREGEA
jgi:UPF0716 protein FxsA